MTKHPRLGTMMKNAAAVPTVADGRVSVEPEAGGALKLVTPPVTGVAARRVDTELQSRTAGVRTLLAFVDVWWAVWNGITWEEIVHFLDRYGYSFNDIIRKLLTG